MRRRPDPVEANSDQIGAVIARRALRDEAMTIGMMAHKSKTKAFALTRSVRTRWVFNILAR